MFFNSLNSKTIATIPAFRNGECLLGSHTVCAIQIHSKLWFSCAGVESTLAPFKHGRNSSRVLRRRMS